MIERQALFVPFPAPTGEEEIGAGAFPCERLVEGRRARPEGRPRDAANIGVRRIRVGIVTRRGKVAWKSPVQTYGTHQFYFNLRPDSLIEVASRRTRWGI